VPDDVAAGAEVGAVAAPAAIVEWRPKAEELVQAGVTQKDPETVARILAERAAGTPPSTIGRRLEVHHSTVGRILAAADENIDESLQPEPAAL
jgi:DNA-binding IclR family transcriptional regulator